MTSKRWRMVVSNLSGDEIRQEVTVESTNWMAALRAGRTELGESGGVPTGSSCSVSPEGTVTILDPMARRRFVLSVDSAESFVQGTPKGPKVPPDEKAPAPAPAPAEAPAAPAPAEAPAAAAPAPAPKKKVPKKTMAYIPADQVPSAPAPKKKAPKKTMAYIPADQIPSAPAAPSQPATPEPAQAPEPAAPAPAAQPAAGGFGPAAKAPEAPAAPPAAAPSPSKPPDADLPSIIVDDAGQSEGGAPWTLHSERDAEPSPENPLTYRERAYIVPEGTSSDACEAVARERLASIQESIAERPRGKFINLAIFDHDWKGRPQRPPVVTLQFKDWQDSLVVDRPLERITAAAKASRSSAPPPAPRKRSTTDEQDNRLATAFEASQDLLFLSTPIEGLEFALDLFEDLATAEGMAACLYDIDDDVHRVAAATGPNADAIRGKAIPFQGGLFGVAAQTPNAAFRVPDVSAESRFDPSIDGWEGLDVRDLLYVPLAAQGRFLGIIQLVNRTKAGGFSQADADLATYIGQQLASFLHQARLKAG